MTMTVRGWVGILTAIMLGSLGCASDDSAQVPEGCAALGERLAECGTSPADLEAYCRANAAYVTELAALDCSLLEGDAGKADGRFGWKREGEECTVNIECAGELVCRSVYVDLDPHDYPDALDWIHASYPRVCVPRASHTAPEGRHRFCDGFASADCVPGDKCVGERTPLGDHYLATCEDERYLEPCSCSTGDPSCVACGPDLVCVDSLCRRPCAWGTECSEGCFNGYCG